MTRKIILGVFLVLVMFMAVGGMTTPVVALDQPVCSDVPPQPPHIPPQPPIPPTPFPKPWPW